MFKVTSRKLTKLKIQLLDDFEMKEIGIFGIMIKIRIIVLNIRDCNYYRDNIVATTVVMVSMTFVIVSLSTVIKTVTTIK